MRLLVIIGFILWSFGASWYWVCIVREGCDPSRRSKSSVVEEATGSTPPLFVSNRDTLWGQSQENFRFPFSSSTAAIDQPVSELLDTLGSFLFYNPNNDLEIIGSVAEDELNLTNFSNLGLARANSVSQILQLNNLSFDRFILSYDFKPRKSLFGPSDTLRGGIELRIINNPFIQGPSPTDIPADSYFNSEEWKALMASPPLLYFDQENTHMILDEQKRKFFTHCVQYLRLVPSQKILLSGYSDNEGAQIINVQRGMERANKAKKLFTEFGVPADRISVLSLGGSDPIANNSSEQGRLKNRRVELSFE